MGMSSAEPSTHWKSPTAIATRYVDIFAVSENFNVCFPVAGPGVSDTMRPLEMAVSPLSTTSVMSNVALKAGSSKDGKARRASVFSNCDEPAFKATFDITLVVDNGDTAI